VLECTATDANGISTIVVSSTSQIATDCGDTARTVTFTVPNDGVKRFVFIVDCANQRERAKFAIRPNGTVVAPPSSSSRQPITGAQTPTARSAHALCCDGVPLECGSAMVAYPPGSSELLPIAEKRSRLQVRNWLAETGVAGQSSLRIVPMSAGVVDRAVPWSS